MTDVAYTVLPSTRISILSQTVSYTSPLIPDRKKMAYITPAELISLLIFSCFVIGGATTRRFLHPCNF